MKYKVFLRICLLALWAAVLPVKAQVDELSGLLVADIGSNALELCEGQWYLMYNRSFKCYAYEQEADHKMFGKASAFSIGAKADDAATYTFLVRLVASENEGHYYLQTGTGRYFGALVDGKGTGVASNMQPNTDDKASASTYIYGTISNAAGHFWLNDAKGVRLDSEGVDKKIVGWGTGPVTSTGGNNNWAFFPVTLRNADDPVLYGHDLAAYYSENQIPVRLFNSLYPFHAMCVTDGVGKAAEKAKGDWSQIWLLAPSGGGFTLRNAKTGMFINLPNADYKAAPITRTPQVYYASAWAGNKAYVVFSTANTVTGHTCLHEGADKTVVRWSGNADNQASGWKIEAADDVDADEIKASINDTPANGKFYMIYNKNYNNPLTESNGRLACAATADGTFSQYWQLTKTDDGYLLRNLGSGRFAKAPVSGASSQYTTAERSEAATFALTQRIVDGDHWLEAYSIADSEDETFGLYCNADHSVVRANCTNDARAAWYFVEADIDKNTLGRAEFMWEHPAMGIYRLKNKANNRYATDRGGTSKLGVEELIEAGEGEDATGELPQIWQMSPTANGGYSLRNLSTGRYVPATTIGAEGAQSTKMAGTFYISKSAAGDGTVVISPNIDFAAGSALGCDGNGTMVSGNFPTESGENSTSLWMLEELSPEEITADHVKDMISQFDGHYPLNATNTGERKFYYIHNNYYNSAICGNTQSNNAICKSTDETNYSQMWEIIPQEGDKEHYAFRNALSGMYIQRKGNGSLSTIYTVGKEPAYFKVVERSETWLFNYAIADEYPQNNSTNSSRGLHCDAASNVVGWYTDALASIWYFDRVEIDAAALEAARKVYEEGQTLANSVSVGMLEKFFTTAACTELREEYAKMDDAALCEAMSDLPEKVQKMALKVKNNTWERYADDWDITEKSWRIADYKPYSDNTKWAWKIGASYVYGRLSNPTGINVKKGELATIYVGSDAPEGTEIKIETVVDCNWTGEQMALKKGLNTIYAPADATLFVFYNVTDTTKVLAKLPPITVHIEGGEVNGYFDTTRGHTDEDWKKMQEHLLKASENLQLKTDKIVFLMPRDRVTAACPEHMTGLMEIWNNILVIQHRVMAADDFKDRFNCILTACAVTYNYMFATSYGTYYHMDTLGEVMNYENMRTGGSIWGPAHENGHVNQNLINMVGCTEVSNNLFSNIAVYEQGYLTSRTTSPQVTFDEFHKRTQWIDRNIWERTRLYWQLYMYYHIQGHNPNFYPALFRLLRNDGMKHPGGKPIPATDDYLKFAVKCCQAAGEDLSEFFEAYGFFEKLAGANQTCGDRTDCKLVDDYGNYYIYVTDEMIAKAKEEMKKCGPAAGNILFIDDRIELTDNKDGIAKRKDWNGQDIAGHYYGNMGQYSDFTADYDCDGYRYTVTEDGHIHIDGAGAVGIKIYDEEGKLIYLSNKTDFDLPEDIAEKVRSGKAEIKAAQGNGTDVSVPDADKPYYTLDVYYGNAESKKIYTTAADKSLLPVLPVNAIAVVAEGENSPNDAESRNLLAETPNFVVNGVAARLDLADKTDFYAPKTFKAASVNYQRANTAGWNSVCLPFAISTEDLGAGSKIAKLSRIVQSGDVTTLVFDDGFSEAAAGEPCLIYCPEGFDSWSFEKTDADVVGMPASAVVVGASDVMMRGSFANTSIGAGKYKLNSKGTAFGITSDEGTVTAFRVYVEGQRLGSQVRTSFFTGNGQVTGAGSSLSDAKRPAAVYDLSGRRVQQPVKGGLYIVDGKKQVW